jgi:phosphatidylglycerophosphate synthase
MPRPGPITFFKQTLKSQQFAADELINIFLLRPVAAALVWLIYPTNITPNHVTVAAICVGMASAWMYAAGTPAAVMAAGILIVLKDIIDDADGQLARAKQQYSRRGRFLDSIGDFVVDVAVFAGIAAGLCASRPVLSSVVLSVLAFWGITLRVSYHVFYQVSFLHLEGKYELNRIVEEVTDADRKGDRVALVLQRVFNVLYGWQDRLMLAIDTWCRGGRVDARLLPTWYGDGFGLRLSGLLGFGTELMLLGACSWFGRLETYLILNCVVMNAVWLASIAYRRYFLSRNLA